MTLQNENVRDIGISDWPRTREALKEEAIRYASVLLNADKDEGQLTAGNDEVEIRLVDEAKRLLIASSSDIAGEISELESVQSQVEMKIDGPDRLIKGLVNDISEAHELHSRRARHLEVVERRAQIATTAEATRHEITRAPRPNTTANIVGFAIGFAGVEALVTAATFLGKTGASGAAAAVGLALTAACTNIGLGGYLLGTLIMPKSSRRNSTAMTAWVFRLVLVLSLGWLLLVNTLLGHFRASAGNFEVAFTRFLANPINVGDMTGLMLVGFGLIISAIWCLKFYVSQDPYLDYGIFGEELNVALSEVAENRADYTFAVREHAAAAEANIDELAEDARAGHRFAKEIRVLSEAIAAKHHDAQEELLLKATETAMYRRSVIREMLGPYGRVPSNIAEPIDLAGLRVPRLSNERHIEFEKSTEDAKNAIVTRCATAKEGLEAVVSQALQLPFGAKIHANTMTGGKYVEQSTE